MVLSFTSFIIIHALWSCHRRFRYNYDLVGGHHYHCSDPGVALGHGDGSGDVQTHNLYVSRLSRYPLNHSPDFIYDFFS